MQQRRGSCSSKGVHGRRGNGSNGCHANMQREKVCVNEHEDVARKTNMSVARDAKPAKKKGAKVSEKKRREIRLTCTWRWVNAMVAAVMRNAGATLLVNAAMGKVAGQGDGMAAVALGATNAPQQRR